MVERSKVTKASALMPVATNTDGDQPAPPATGTPATPAQPGVLLPPAAPVPSDTPAVPRITFNDSAAPYRHVWARTEYLVWYLKQMATPPVLGTIPNADAMLGSLPPGAITPAFGGPNVSFGALSGVRLELGVGLDADGVWAVSGEFFQLEHASRGASLSSDSSGSPTLGPVFFDPVVGKETILLFSNPGLQTGAADDVVGNRFWGFEVDGRRRLTSVFGDRLDLIVGYRHLGFDESLDAAGTSNLIGTTPSPASTITYTDHFGVHNDFDGAVVGLEAEYDLGRLYLDLRGKFGMGNVRESGSISGSTTFVSTEPAVPGQQFNGGVLAQPSNSGQFSRDRFSFLGEITVNGGVRLYDDHVKLYAGYNFLGLSKVARASDLLDGVDSTTVPSIQGPMRSLTVSAPAQKVDDGRFWAQGLNLGLAFEY
jgi:hypothetical protein